MNKKIYKLLLLLLILVLSQAMSGQWTEMFPTTSPPPRSDFGMAYLEDGKVLLFGGYIYVPPNHIAVNDTWIYDLSENTWTEVLTDVKPPSRVLHVLTRLEDGKVLLFGGWNWENDITLGDTWIFDYQTLSWTELHPTRKPRYRERASGAYLGDGKVLIYSGWPGPVDYYEDAWIFDINTKEWDSVATASPWGGGREGASMCEINDHLVLLFGGWENKQLNDNWLFDRNIGRWKGFAPRVKNFGRSSHDMAFLTNNKILLFGGDSWPDTTNPDAAEYSDDTWIFDFEDTTWIKIKPDVKPLGRSFHKLAHIGDGNAILFGGSTKQGLNAGGGTWLFEYEPTKVVEKSNSRNFKIQILNISQDEYLIHLKNLNSNTLKIELFDSMGFMLKELYNGVVLLGNSDINLNTDDLANGIYFIRFSTKEHTHIEKVMIVR